MKHCNFSNCNQVFLSAQSTAKFNIKEAIVSAFKLSAQVEDCLVEDLAVLEEETAINAGGDECYREHFQVVPYQRLKHNKLNSLLWTKWSRFLCSVLYVFGVVFQHKLILVHKLLWLRRYIFHLSIRLICLDYEVGTR